MACRDGSLSRSGLSAQGGYVNEKEPAAREADAGVAMNDNGRGRSQTPAARSRSISGSALGRGCC